MLSAVAEQCKSTPKLLRKESCWVTLYYGLLLFLIYWIIYLHFTPEIAFIPAKIKVHSCIRAAVTLSINFPGVTWVLCRDWPPPSILTSQDITSEEQQETQVRKYFSSNFTRWGWPNIIFSAEMTTEVCGPHKPTVCKTSPESPSATILYLF